MALANPQAAPALVGSSAATRTLDDDITAASRSDAKVLITGESGVGKDVAARLIHARSPRARQTLVTINCAGLPDIAARVRALRPRQGQLHRRAIATSRACSRWPTAAPSSSTKSARCRCGCRRCCSASSRPARSSGSAADRQVSRVDVRVICATHRDLRLRVREGTFREDLFYRLNVIHIHIPPLRERREDVRDLARSTSSTQFAEHHGVAPPVPTPRRWRCCWPTTGRATSASCATCSSAWCCDAPDVVTPDDLPRELRLGPGAVSSRRPPTGRSRKPGPASPAGCLAGCSSAANRSGTWCATPFLAHDLTRQQIRDVIQAGLEQCQGRYNALTELFNMPKRDYRRFLGALKKFDCLVSAPIRAGVRKQSRTPTSDRLERAEPARGRQQRSIQRACRSRWCRSSRARPGSSSRASARRRSAGSSRRRRRSARPTRGRRSTPPTVWREPAGTVRVTTIGAPASR